MVGIWLLERIKAIECFGEGNGIYAKYWLGKVFRSAEMDEITRYRNNVK